MKFLRLVTLLAVVLTIGLALHGASDKTSEGPVVAFTYELQRGDVPWYASDGDLRWIDHADGSSTSFDEHGVPRSKRFADGSSEHYKADGVTVDFAIDPDGNIIDTSPHTRVEVPGGATKAEPAAMGLEFTYTPETVEGEIEFHGTGGLDGVYRFDPLSPGDGGECFAVYGHFAVVSLDDATGGDEAWRYGYWMDFVVDGVDTEFYDLDPVSDGERLCADNPLFDDPKYFSTEPLEVGKTYPLLSLIYVPAGSALDGVIVDARTDEIAYFAVTFIPEPLP